MANMHQAKVVKEYGKFVHNIEHDLNVFFLNVVNFNFYIYSLIRSGRFFLHH